MFEIKPVDPQTYRQQTRRSTLIVAVIFIALAMLLSSLAVMLFGEPGGDNFRFNIGGVAAGVVLTIAWYAVRSGHRPGWRRRSMAGSSSAA